MCCSRVKCAARSCAFVSKSATESINIEADGHGKRTNGNSDIQAISIFKTKAVLGESLLGERVLC